MIPEHILSCTPYRRSNADIIVGSELNSLIMQYKETGDKAIKDKIIMSNIRLVPYAVNDLLDNSPDLIKYLDDLLQEGLIGLMVALEHFVPEKGAFSTYAIYWIKTYARRYIINSLPQIRIPEITLRKKQKVGKFIREYYLTHGHYPDTQLIQKEVCKINF